MVVLFCCQCIGPDTGQLELECGTAHGAIARRQATAKVRGNARRNGESKANAFARFFCRVKRLEQIVRIVDPMAIVTHGERHRVTNREEDVDMRIFDSIHRIQECHVMIYHILWDLVHTLLADERGDLNSPSKA